MTDKKDYELRMAWNDATAEVSRLIMAGASAETVRKAVDVRKAALAAINAYRSR